MVKMTKRSDSLSEDDVLVFLALAVTVAGLATGVAGLTIRSGIVLYGGIACSIVGIVAANSQAFRTYILRAWHFVHGGKGHKPEEEEKQPVAR